MLKNKVLKIILIIASVFIVGAVLTIPIKIKLADNYIQKGNENLKNNYYKSAFTDYEKASALFPSNERVNVQLGKIYLLKENLPNAEEEFGKAFDINKNNSEAYTELVKTLLLEKKLKEAEKYTKKASSKILEEPGVQIQTTRVYASLGKIDDALNMLRSDSEEASFYKGILYFAKNNLESGNKLIEELDTEEDALQNKISIIKSALEKTKTNENETYKNIVLAQALNEIDEPYLAELKLKEVLAKNPDYRDALIFLGYSNLLKKDYQEAKNYLSKAIEKDNVYSLPHFFLGRVYLEENNIGEAKNNFGKAIELGYRNKQSYKYLGGVVKQTNNYQEAEISFKKSLEYSQKDEEITFELLDVLISEQKLDEAEKIALEHEDDKFLGWVYLEKGDLEKSLAYLKKAQENEPSSAFISLKLGELYKKQNKNSEAKECFLKTEEFDLTGQWAPLAQEKLKSV